MSLADLRNRVLAEMPKREIAAAAVVEAPPETRHGLLLDFPESGKTTFTVPATRQAASEAMERWLLRIEGRFVGAEVPNNNGAMWTAEDLLYGQPTVAMGPLNWLHNEKKVVGVITDSTYVERQAASNGTIVQPFLQASSVLWRWLYPGEASLTERAADKGALWYCVDTETELLTASGWKRESELVVGEPILTLDTVRGLSEWLPLENVFRYDVDTEMVAMEGQQHSSLTTPNHRWVVRQRRGTGDYTIQWRETDQLTHQSQIPRVVPHAGPVEAKYADELVELVAWFWTEGTIAPGGASVIYQSHVVNPLYCDRIRLALTRLFGDPAKVRAGGLWYPSHHGKMTYYHLSREASALLLHLAPNRVVAPGFLSALTQAQLRLFIETSIDADGCRANADGQISIFQKDLDRLRSFEMACALAGMPTNTSPAPGGWRTCVVRRSTHIAPKRLAALGKGFTVERRQYRGLIWCPSTPNGTFLARRRGTVYWTGNSMECIADNVECRPTEGGPGCGAKFSYVTYMRERAKTCEHMMKGTAPRRFENPVFQGGAIIVPPVRPAWADADADVVRVAAALADDLNPADFAVDEDGLKAMLRLVAAWQKP